MDAVEARGAEAGATLLAGLPLAAVGFDLDFTLWDQDAFARSFFASVAGELGRRLGLGRHQVEAACAAALERLTLAHPRLFDQVLHQLGAWDPRLVDELVLRYRRHRPPAQPYPGAVATLAWLREAGLRLFLVTDGQPGSQRHKVTALGLGHWFDVRVFTGELPPGQQKPSPDPFRIACAHLALAPEHCLYVGDNPGCDFRGPRSLGMGTLGVRTGPFAAAPADPDARPDGWIGSVADLPGLLESAGLPSGCRP
jgi:putative hydrolase of the HAD superfamily